MSQQDERETLEEQEIVCEYCGKKMGFLRWFIDWKIENAKCPTCGDTGEENEGKYICVDCRNKST